MSETKKPNTPPPGWPKGVSGNPGGRPKGYDRRLREVVDGMMADDPTNKGEKIPAFEAIVKQAVLDAVAGDKYARDFVADRLMGKPKQTVDARITDSAPRRDWSAVPIEERRELLGKINSVPLVSAEVPADERVH